jgi:hypothetical protein
MIPVLISVEVVPSDVVCRGNKIIKTRGLVQYAMKQRYFLREFTASVNLVARNYEKLAVILMEIPLARHFLGLSNGSSLFALSSSLPMNFLVIFAVFVIITFLIFL